MNNDLNRWLMDQPQVQALIANPEGRLLMVQQLMKQFEEMAKSGKISSQKYSETMRWASKFREQAFVDRGQRMMQRGTHIAGPMFTGMVSRIFSPLQ